MFHNVPFFGLVPMAIYGPSWSSIYFGMSNLPQTHADGLLQALQVLGLTQWSTELHPAPQDAMGYNGIPWSQLNGIDFVGCDQLVLLKQHSLHIQCLMWNKCLVDNMQPVATLAYWINHCVWDGQWWISRHCPDSWIIATLKSRNSLLVELLKRQRQAYRQHTIAPLHRSAWLIDLVIMGLNDKHMFEYDTIAVAGWEVYT